jgi:hypothetical protein
MASGRKKTALLVPAIVLPAAATALAYGPGALAGGASSMAPTIWTEPVALMLSGSALLWLAGAVRRVRF